MRMQLYAVKQAAARLAVDKMTVHRPIWDGNPPYVDLGKPGKRPRIRVTEAALNEFVSAREPVARVRRPSAGRLA
ncbi:hypothetical protein Vqi01_59030 [Micromonospora qiuiae]|uniref:DNA-binding protein n=1 Tax=Micromonospora qiuiae TaxID=502268 RepID=A0ABQ4JJW0_9ACTN|nr:hypothetical protein Vqi01_59030 [Micromonospora qiuiae]